MKDHEAVRRRPNFTAKGAKDAKEFDTARRRRNPKTRRDEGMKSQGAAATKFHHEEHKGHEDDGI